MASALTIKDLTVAYPQGFGGEKTVLKGLSLDVKPGEIFGLLGPNGAGKTTLIKSIVGLIGAKGGSIELFGSPAALPASRSRLGYMPETANYYFFMTAGEILALFGRLAGMDQKTLRGRIDDTLALVGLSDEKDRLVKTFSKGMQVRLNIAQAILHDPELLILDEPFSGLDPLGRIAIRNILKRKKSEGKTLFLSSHELSEAELICDSICIIRGGKILKDGPIKRLLDEKGEGSLENYFVEIIKGQG